MTENLFMKASAVVATYNLVSRYGVAIRPASGPCCGDGRCGSGRGLWCLDFDFHACRDDDERECRDTRRAGTLAVRP